jgi:predicted transcriptional regulator
MVDAVPGKSPGPQVLRMTADVVAAYLRRNQLPSAQIADIITAVYRSLERLGQAGPGVPPEGLRPAVPVRRSIHPDYLVCLEDGKKLKMLKRHLRATYSLTPEQYRSKWHLPPDYPMVAPAYAEERSAFAKKIGLGRGGRKPPRRPATPKR